MNHLTELTPYHIHNLETLAEFLGSDKIPPPQFNIVNYINPGVKTRNLIITNGEEQLRNIKLFYSDCGTTACAVGHGPLAGIPAKEGEDWQDYEKRVFGVSADDYYNIFCQTSKHYAWKFMFGPQWVGENNTAKGTAARIRYFLKYGYPDPWNDFEAYTELDLEANQG